jgi:hypothetical protein
MRTLSDRFVKKIKTHILCSVTFFGNLTIYEKMWKNFVEPGRPQITIWRMRIACWIPEATDTHTEYVILISFLLQQWLNEITSMLPVLLTIKTLFLHYSSELQKAKLITPLFLSNTSWEL